MGVVIGSSSERGGWLQGSGRLQVAAAWANGRARCGSTVRAKIWLASSVGVDGLRKTLSLGCVQLLLALLNSSEFHNY